ncbi:hypothetical protein KKF86_02690 [bacterium]|nr:hypothetical protein [bacterium]
MKKYIQLILSIVLFIGLTSDVIASDRSIVKIGSDVHIEKDMRVDDAVAVGGSVFVDGIVDGDAVAVGGSVHLGEEAIIHGDAVTVGGTIEESEGSIVYGTTVDVGSFDFKNIFEGKHFFGGHRGIPGIPMGLKFIPLIGLIALVLLLAVLIPAELGTVASYIKNEPIMMFLWGMLGVILIVPLAVMLAISIIGIALIPLEILAVFLATLIGYIAVAIMIGKKLLRSLKNDNPSVVLSAILGVLILWLVGLIPVFGCIVKAIALIIGFGAVIIAVAKRNKKKNELIIEPELIKVVEKK